MWQLRALAILCAIGANIWCAGSDHRTTTAGRSGATVLAATQTGYRGASPQERKWFGGAETATQRSDSSTPATAPAL